MISRCMGVWKSHSVTDVTWIQDLAFRNSGNCSTTFHFNNFYICSNSTCTQLLQIKDIICVTGCQRGCSQSSSYLHLRPMKGLWSLALNHCEILCSCFMLFWQAFPHISFWICIFKLFILWSLSWQNIAILLYFFWLCTFSAKVTPLTLFCVFIFFLRYCNVCNQTNLLLQHVSTSSTQCCSNYRIGRLTESRIVEC